MTIDFEAERMIALKDAPKHIPGRPHFSTVFRWATRQHNPLETIKVGNRLFTSIEAIARFVGRCNRPDGDTAPAVRTSKERKSAQARADRILQEAGIASE